MELEKKLHKIFALCAVLAGFLLIILMPPLMNPDEPEHFSRAVSVSQGKIASLVVNHHAGNNKAENYQAVNYQAGNNKAGNYQAVNYQAGNYVPSALLEFKKLWAPMFHDTRIKTNFAQINASKNIRIDKNSVAFSDKAFSDTAYSGAAFSNQGYQTLYFPLAYLPQSAGILVASAFTTSVYRILLWAKIFLLAFYTAAGYFAIKITPVYKWLFFLILLMPSSVASGASVSADGVLIPLCMLFFACVFKYSFDDRFYADKKGVLCLCVLALALALIKQSFLLTLFVLLVPKKKFKLPYAASIAFILVPGFLAAVAWSIVSSGWFVPLNTSNPVVQAEFILAHPFLYLLTILKTIKLCFVMWVYMAIGVLGWNNVFLLPPVYVLYLAALLCAGVFGQHKCSGLPAEKNGDDGDITSEADKKTTLLKFQKIVLFALVVINFVFIATELYLSWTPPYFTQFISIIQGRYLIPLILPLLVLVGSVFEPCWRKQKLFEASSIVVLIVTYLNLYMSVFVTYYF